MDKYTGEHDSADRKSETCALINTPTLDRKKGNAVPNRNRFPRFVIFQAMLLTAMVYLPGGCPTGTPPADSSGTTGGASGSLVLGSLVVEIVADASNTEYDIYDLPGGESVRSYQSANTTIDLQPGLYYLTEYFNADFRYASDVTITAGSTTTVTLGAIQLVTVTDASDGYYDIYDSTGATEYSSYNAANASITAPAGTFTLKEYFNGYFDYATNVVVVAGETTTVEMGGIKLVTVEGASDGTYAVYDSGGTVTYATYNEPDVIITAPPGTFTLKEYFNDKFTYASNVQVLAGEVTTVPMGAIRYNGSQAYDIYVGGTLVSSYNEAGAVITAPAGTYTLMKYFDDETVLAGNVVVIAGAITDAS